MRRRNDIMMIGDEMDGKWRVELRLVSCSEA